MKHLFKTINILIVSVIILTIGCSKQGNSINCPTININDENVIFDIKLSDIVEDYQITTLQTIKESLIGSIDELKVFNDTIYILDKNIAKAIFFFNMKGEFIGKISSKGKGEGEFLKPNSFDIDEVSKQLVVYCSATSKLLRYKLNGDFLAETKLSKADINGNSLTVLNGSIYMDVYPKAIFNDDSIFCEIDSKGKIQNKFLSNNKHRLGFLRMHTFGQTQYSGKDRIIVTQPFMQTAYKIDSTGLSPLVTISTSNKFTYDEVSKMNKLNSNEFFKTIYNRKSDNFVSMADYVETSYFNFLSFTTQSKIYRIIFTDNLNHHIVFHNIKDDILNIPIVTFIGQYDNNLIRVINGDDMAFLINELKTGSVSSKGVNLPNHIDDSNNPILVFYKTKHPTTLFEKN